MCVNNNLQFIFWVKVDKAFWTSNPWVWEERDLLTTQNMCKNISSSSLQELVKLSGHLVLLVHPELQLLQLLPQLVLLDLCLLLPFPETKCCWYFVVVIFFFIFCCCNFTALFCFCYFVAVICQLISPCHNIFGCWDDLSAHLVWPDMIIIINKVHTAKNYV